MANQKRYVTSKAKSWALGVSSTGKEQVAVSFPIPDAEGGEYHLAWYGFFTEGTVERTIESLRLLGFEGDDLTNLVGLDKNSVELVIEEEEYPQGSGQFQEKIQWINRGGGALVKTPLEGEKAKTFAALMREKFRVHDAQAGKKPAAAAKPKTPNRAPPPSGPLGGDPPPADDIPF